MGGYGYEKDIVSVILLFFLYASLDECSNEYGIYFWG